MTEIIKCDNESLEMAKILVSTASLVEREMQEIDLKYEAENKSVAVNLDVPKDVVYKDIILVDRFKRNVTGCLTHISCYKSGLLIVTPSGETKVSVQIYLMNKKK